MRRETFGHRIFFGGSSGSIVSLRALQFGLRWGNSRSGGDSEVYTSSEEEAVVVSSTNQFLVRLN